MRFGPTPRSLSVIVSGVERLRLVVAAVVTPLALSLSKRPSDDGCYENGKVWILEHGRIWQNPRGLPKGFHFDGSESR